jgi:hypothetical protein
MRWDISPRLIIIDSSSSEIVMQDLVDSLRWLEASVEGIDEPYLLEASGKEDLGSGVTVGLTLELQNAQIYFEQRSWQNFNGTATSNDLTGTILTDTGADFINDLVVKGDIVLNKTTGSLATILEVTATQLTTLPLTGGLVRDTWEIGDTFSAYPNQLCVTGGGNLVAVDPSGNSIYPILQSPNVQSTLTSSSSATNQNVDAIQYSSYNGGVWIDIAGSPGTEYPNGTPAQPVNNLTEAHTILAENGFSQMFFLSDWTFTSGSYMDGHTLIGEGFQRTTFTFDPGSLVPNVEIVDAKVTGSIAGVVGFDSCHITDLNSIGVVPSSQDVIFNACLFDGSLGLPSNYSGTIKILDCWSNVAGVLTPTFNMGDASANVLCRNYAGGLKIINSSKDNDISIDLVSGQVILDSTITNGNITVRGVGNITDDSSGAIVDITGLMSKTTVASAVQDQIGLEIQYASYQNAVWVDPSNGTAGTTVYPAGTRILPVRDISTAIYIAETVGFKTLQIINDISINGGSELDNYTLIGDSHVATEIEILESANVQGIKIIGAHLSGYLDGEAEINNCVVRNVSYVNGHIHDSGLIGPIVLDGSANAVLINCSAIDGYNLPIIDMGVGGQNLIMSDWTGFVTITNNSDPSTQIFVGMDAGKVTLDASIEAGDITISGIGTFTNNASTGIVLDTEGLMNKTNIADAVLNTDLAPYSTDFTVATALQLGAYNDGVYVDAADGSVGIIYPYGTPELPVNTVELGVTIALSLGFTNIHIHGDYVFDSSILVPGLTFIGDGNTKSRFTFPTKMIIPSISLKEAELTGWLSGISYIENCHIIDFGSDTFIPQGGEIQVVNSLIEGTITLPNTYSGTFQVLNCWAMPDPSGTPPVIDHGGSSADLQIRNLSGFMTITDVSANVDIRVFLNSGGVVLENSVTDGDFLLTGTGLLVNNSIGTRVDSKGLVSGGTVDNTYLAVEALRPHHTGFGKTVYWDYFSGNDLYDGTSESLAVQTFARAHDLVTDGAHDVIFALATDTGQTVVDERITISKKYTFLRGPGRDLKIKPTDASGATISIAAAGVEISGLIAETSTGGINHAVHVEDGADFFLIENFWSNFSTGTTIHVAGGSIVYGRINNTFISHGGEQGIHIEGNVRHTKITNTEIDTCGLNGILIDGSVARNNIIDDGTVIYNSGEYGIRINAPGLRNLIKRNISVYDNASGSLLDLGTDTQYEGDIIRLATAAAVWDVDVSGLTNTNSAGNTLWNNTKKTINGLIPFIFSK